MFNPEKTYISIIMGDGDNLAYQKHQIAAYIEDRQSSCAAPEGDNNKCSFPLVWTLSPRMREVLPRWMKHWYRVFRETGKDFVTMPPSGSLYR